jgi:hypothetical protein
VVKFGVVECVVSCCVVWCSYLYCNGDGGCDGGVVVNICVVLL